MERFVRVYQLYDIYGQFLTPKQRQAVELYYGHDLSLAEIAEEMGTSRQAVHDLLRRSEQALQDYEEKLGLARRYEEQQRHFAELESLLRQLEDTDSRWQRVFELLAVMRR
ncbi:MAG: YlxM family DNA-binding protein [Firmicutes bacterium]|nr:YlxM family DNA-binding protein [Bacillota bacterium]